MRYTYRDFSPLLSLWTHRFWCLLVLLLSFVSPLPHQQSISLWGFFSSRKTNKKYHSGGIGWIERLGHRGHAVFGQKLLNTQHSVGGWARKSAIMKWANVLKESSKKSPLKLNAASHNNASWYIDTDGFLEHWPIRGSLYYQVPALQKIIPFFCGPLIR